MNSERLRFVVSAVPGLVEGYEQPDALAAGEASPALTGDERWGDAQVVRTLAGQIISGEPPATWETAHRLWAQGHSPKAVLEQLGLALQLAARQAALREESIDLPSYVATLRHLPIPDPGAVESAVLDAVLDDPGIADDALCQSVLARLGRPPDDELTRHVVDLATEGFLDDGSMSRLSGNRTVHSSIAVGSVLTHRMTGAERKRAMVAASDLAPFSLLQPLRLESGEEIDIFDPDPDAPGELAWQGPDGWLDGFEAGYLLAVGVTPDGPVSIRTVPEPPHDDDLVERVRRAYDLEVGGGGLPVPLQHIVYTLLLDDPEAFAAPRRPLTELCEAAGLHLEAGRVADDPEVWANKAGVELIGRAVRTFEGEDHRCLALSALEAVQDPESTPAQLRKAMARMRQVDVFGFVVDEMLYCDHTNVEVRALAGIAASRLLVSARRKPEMAVASLFAAVVAEREGEPLAAEEHVKRSLEADRAWPPALDRAAWYAFDRGDAAEAVRLWTLMDRPPSGDLSVARSFADMPRHHLGRNQPCWCRSGRRFKDCHHGRLELAPLPERVDWLHRKATAYVMRRGTTAREHVVRHAMARVLDQDDPDEDPVEILGDPIVIDTVLTEGGWFERFLAERGPLLPDDEALLASAWALVPRTVYEVEDVQPGTGLILRDLAAATSIEVRERMLSHKIVVGERICARAVPDGETHQLVGAVFPVINGTEAQVMKLCDEGLGDALCRYVAELHRRPVLMTREDEPLVLCTALVRVADPKALRRLLSERYIADRGGWVEVHTIAPGDAIVRAQLGLHGNRLTIETHSEARMDRVLDVLRSSLPGTRVLRDERRPPMPDEISELAGLAGTDDRLPSHARLDLVMGDVQASMERRWVDRPNAALGGLTPREAAADPTRIEQLERVIQTFPDEARRPSDGPILARPDRLRSLLGLPGVTGPG